jgi:hypothetical protein
MWSSTPIVLIPRSRSGSVMRCLAAFFTAAQQVSDATPRCRAIADTVVSSCRNASTAQVIARLVSFARTAAKEWSSVHVYRWQRSSRQRQIRLCHRTRTGRPKHGARGGPGLADRARRLRHRSRGIP